VFPDHRCDASCGLDDIGVCLDLHAILLLH
jgi:hypothetical protein